MPRANWCPSDRTWPTSRRKGGLGKDAERASERAAQLTAIDPDWNCPWPLDWQRHHHVLADLVDADGTLPDIQPGVLFEGDDLGKWLERMTRDWTQLSTEQQERLTALGIKPAKQRAPNPAQKSAAGAGKASTAFQRGVAALAQYISREGKTSVPRGHTEEIVIDGEAEPVFVRLGVFVRNRKSRRDKLTQPQRIALAELGVEWA
jgi:hypothetical protein